LNGLAASSVLSGAVNLALLVVAYNAWVGSLQFGRLGRSLVKFVFCGAALVLTLQLHELLLQQIGKQLGGVFFAKALALMLIISLGAVSYLATAHVLGIPEFRETFSTLTSKIKRKLPRLRR
jgi:uncharacterized membrane protein